MMKEIPVWDRCNFFSMVVEERSIWFVSTYDVFEGLYRYDIDDDTTYLIDALPDEENGTDHSLVRKINGRIVIAPYHGNGKFWIYDIEKKEFAGEQMQEDVWNGDLNNSAFSNAYISGNSVFFIGNANGLIVEYRDEERGFITHKLELPKDVEMDDCRFFWDAGTLVNDKELVMAVWDKPYLLHICLEDFSVKTILIDKDFSAACASAMKDGSLLILPCTGNKAAVFNSGKATEYIKLPENEGTFVPFIKYYPAGTEGILIPALAKDVYILTADKEVKPLKKMIFGGEKYDAGTRKIIALDRDPSGNVVALDSNKRFFVIDDNCNATVRDILWPRERYDRIKTAKKKMYTEGVEMSLGEFVNSLF